MTDAVTALDRWAYDYSEHNSAMAYIIYKVSRGDSSYSTPYSEWKPFGITSQAKDYPVYRLQ
jgi:hypothetical protein